MKGDMGMAQNIERQIWLDEDRGMVLCSIAVYWPPALSTIIWTMVYASTLTLPKSIRQSIINVIKLFIQILATLGQQLETIDPSRNEEPEQVAR